ncbi:MAG: DUF3786 domain-containing protein [Deltaproteobacteria bacterium]|nr:DUF3786 domain-containing protein [Deltaproteobacteria bacterium]MBW2053645.1 DUF3786 domain-containing protein [Deltaproteobacteria bacterium]MBW2324047.1 DUF3786 domain-containing protein [Deltaproteobacteria bacterium]
MPRKDDFINAFKIAAAELKDRDPAEVSRLSAVKYDDDNKEFLLDFIGRPHVVRLPEVMVQNLEPDLEVPIQEQGLILHYLNMADGEPLTREYITYREIPSGEFYYPAFVKRAEAPLTSVFGSDTQKLISAARSLGGEIVSDMGDAAVSIQAFPRVVLTLVLWEGDDEFEPAGKILFDRSVSHYLSVEDVAVLSGMVVYRLMRFAS